MSASRGQLAWDLPGNCRRTRMVSRHQHSRTRCDLFDLFGELTTRLDSICFTTEKLRVNIPQDVAPVAAPGATVVFGKSECPFRFAALNLSLMGDGIVRGLLVLRQRPARSPAAPLRPIARWINLDADSSE